MRQLFFCNLPKINLFMTSNYPDQPLSTPVIFYYSCTANTGLRQEIFATILLCENFSHVNKTLVYSIWFKRNNDNQTIVQLKVNSYITFVWEMVTENISPVQVSGYVLLIFGIAFIFSCKTEPCSNLGEKKNLNCRLWM